MREFNKSFNIVLGAGTALLILLIVSLLLYSLIDNKYPDLFNNNCNVVEQN